MINVNDTNYQQKIERYLLKKERKQKNISLDELSNKIGKSKQYLSEIENGKKYNQDTIKALFEVIGINFNFNIENSLDILRTFDDYIFFHISMNKKERLKCEEILLDEKNKISYHYPIYILTLFISKRLSVKEEGILYVKEMFEEIKFLCDEYLISIFYYFCGTYYKNQKNIELAEIYLKKSIDFNCDSVVLGMAYNQLGVIKFAARQLYEASKLQLKSKELLQKYNCYKRLTFTETCIGDIFMLMGLKEESEEQYLKVIRLCKQLNRKTGINIALYNLAYGMMVIAKDYHKAIYYAQELKNETNLSKEYYYLLSWSYYHLNEKKIAQKYLELLDQVNDHSSLEIDTYACCLHYLLKGKHEQYFSKLQKYYQTIENNINVFDTIIALEWLIQYCKEHQMYQEGFEYYEKYSTLIKKVKLFFS